MKAEKGKIIAVWGSPASGKSTFAVKLATAIYDNFESTVIVLFTDMDEHVVTFQMVERETLNPMDAEGMEAGDWDLTLFTCTIDGQTRVTIRLERVEVFRNPETEEPAKSEK